MSAAGALANLGAYSLQLTLLAVAGGLAARAMRLRAPGAMLAYWQGLLAACLLLPALQPWRAVADGRGAVTWETTAGPAAGPGPHLSLAPALAIALAAGVLLRAGWLALGWRRLAHCRGRARLLDVLPESVADLPERLGVRARFYVSGEIDAPATNPAGVSVAAGAEPAAKRLPERKLVTKVNPVYPPEAKKDKLEGIVLLDITIEKTGEVSSVSPIKGPEALREAAVAAVRQWRYEPSDVGPTRATITVRFILDKSKGKDKP